MIGAAQLLFFCRGALKHRSGQSCPGRHRNIKFAAVKFVQEALVSSDLCLNPRPPTLDHPFTLNLVKFGVNFGIGHLPSGDIHVHFEALAHKTVQFRQLLARRDRSASLFVVVRELPIIQEKL